MTTMVEKTPPPPPNPNPNHRNPPPLLTAQPPPTTRIIFPRPPIRITTDFDSDSSIFTNKISCKLFQNLAKLKLRFLSNAKGEVCEPQLGVVSKHLSIHYDVEEQNALVSGNFELGPRLAFRGSHDLKGQGEVAMVAKLADPGYKFELSSAVPSVGLPKATFIFPLGEISLVEREEDEETKRLLSVNGILKSKLLNGVCSANFKDENLQLRYSYKDEEMSFAPVVSLPSNAFSFAFKRRFGPSDKLSYWYNFDSSDWSAVYKHTYGKDFKVKAGYDSEVRLGWASLWVGNGSGKAKMAPMKMTVQLMLQVPQDDVRSPLLLFRVKKRWDV